MIIDPPQKSRLLVFLVLKGFPFSEIEQLDQMALWDMAKLVLDVEQRGLDPDNADAPLTRTEP